MIVLTSVKKRKNKSRIFQDLTATFHNKRHYVIFGLPQSGKSTLLKLLCGLQKPSKGRIRRYGSVTPPIGNTEILVAGATILEAAALYSAIYRVNLRDYTDFVRDFSGWDSLDVPATILPPDIRLRLAFALGYGLPADFYLFDGSIAYGRGDFGKQCRQAFESRQREAATIYTTRTTRDAEQYGNIGGVLHGGVLTMYDSVAEAGEVYTALLCESDNGGLAVAEALAMSGRYSEARDYLLRAARREEPDIDSHKLLANVAARSGSYDIALESLRRALELDPNGDREAYHTLIVQTASRAGKLNVAADHLEFLLELNPDQQSLKVQLAKLYLRLGDDRSAVATWKQAAVGGLNSQETTAAVQAATRVQDWTGAIQIIDMYLEATPDDLIILEMKILPLLSLGAFADFKATILRIASVNMPRALMAGLRSISLIPADQIFELLLSLKAANLDADPDPKLYSRYLMALENLARAEHKAGNGSEGERIREMASQIKSALQRKEG